MRKTKEEAAVTRNRLLSAALVVFSRKGYAATTLNDIADEAEVTRGAIYWHFGSKAELYNALVQERFAETFAGLSDVLSQPGAPSDRLRHFLLWTVDLVEDDPNYRAVLELTLFKTEASEDLSEGIAQKVSSIANLVSQYEDLISQAVEQGEFRRDLDVNAAALAALALTTGLTSLWLMNPGAFSLKERTRASVDLFFGSMLR